MVGGVTHDDPSQHPLPHVEALQLAFTTQVPVGQVSCALHEVHVAPPVPQAVVLRPGRQRPAWQQPFGHVAGPHGASHAWLVQPVTQLEQAVPPVPQACGIVPGWQTPPAQHPEGQVAGEQPPVQTPPSRSQLPVPHETHAMPPLPHSDAVNEVTHDEPMQQPLGQVVALHTDIPHWPPVHAVAPQSRQARPPVPHAEDDGVVTQVSPMQQPAHEAGVH